jgi:hypothetical protein
VGKMLGRIIAPATPFMTSAEFIKNTYNFVFDSV